MVSRSKRYSIRPNESMINLVKEGYISELDEFKNSRGKSVWKFKMGKFTFHYDDNSTDVDLSKYRIRIVYSPRKKPPRNLQVWIENIELPQGTKHTYRNGTLCLFKPQNFEWKKGMTIETDLFSTICTWLYHHEVWKRTNIWHGEEAKH